MSETHLLLIQTLAALHSGHPEHPDRLSRDAGGRPQLRPQSLKGALRKQYRDQLYPKYQAEDDWKNAANQDPGVVQLFGSPDRQSQGNLNCSALDVLFLPVRTLNGVFAWVTTPETLQQHLGVAVELPVLETFQTLCASNHPCLMENKDLVLEEFCLERQDADLTDLQQALVARALPAEVLERMALVSAELFDHLLRFALVSYTYTEPRKGQIRHLEALPPYTLMSASLQTSAEHLQQLLAGIPGQLMLGSHQSSGLGFSRILSPAMEVQA